MRKAGKAEEGPLLRKVSRTGMVDGVRCGRASAEKPQIGSCAPGDLVEGALFRRFVWAPAEEVGAVAESLLPATKWSYETSATELWLKRLPFG